MQVNLFGSYKYYKNNKSVTKNSCISLLREKYASQQASAGT